MNNRKISGGLRCDGCYREDLPHTPLISVVTIVYNDVENIEKTMASIRSQTYKNVEYIVIDGGSDDGTIDKIKKNEQHIDYWLSEKDKGISDAFNKGIKSCRGRYIGLLNSGDWYENGTLEKIARLCVDSDSADIVYGDLRYHLADGRCSVQVPDHSKLSRYMSICHPSMFVRSVCYQQVGLYSCEYRIAMDYDFAYRAHRQEVSFKYIPEVFTNMVAGGVSAMHIKRSIYEVAKVKIKNSGSLVTPVAYYLYQITRHIAGNIVKRSLNQSVR